MQKQKINMIVDYKTLVSDEDYKINPNRHNYLVFIHHLVKKKDDKVGSYCARKNLQSP